MNIIKHPAKISKLYIIKLSLPIFFSNLAIPMVGIVDTGLMGHLSDQKFLAAVSISTAVITMIYWSFGFLRMGTVGLVAQALGRGDYREIVLTTMRNMIIAVLIGFTIIASQNYIISQIENFFATSENLQILIDKYISVRVFSAPAELTIYVLTGLFLGLQRTGVSSFLVIFFCTTNIIFSAFFVLNLHLDIYGVALGTVISAYLTIIIFTTYTFFYIKKRFNIIPRFRKLLVRKKIFRLLNINFDILIRTVLLTFAFLWVTYQGSKLGEEFVAINAILIQLIALASFFLDAYAFSTEGIVGFAIGKKSKKSFLQAVSNAYKLSFVTGILISIFYLFFYKIIINSLTDLDYLRFLSYSYVLWVVIIPPVASFCYQLDGIFIGASQTADMRNCMIISVVLFILFSLYLIENLHNHGIWLALLFFMIIRSLTLNFFYPKILNKL